MCEALDLYLEFYQRDNCQQIAQLEMLLGLHKMGFH